MFIQKGRISSADLLQLILLLLGMLFMFCLSLGCWLFHEYATCVTDSDCTSVQVCDDQLCRLQEGVQICGSGYPDCATGFECDVQLAVCIEIVDMGEDVENDAGDTDQDVEADTDQDVEADTSADVEDTSADVEDASADVEDTAEDTTTDVALDLTDADTDVDDTTDLTDADALQVDIPPSCGDGNVDDGEECDDELDPLDDTCFDTCHDGSAGDPCASNAHCGITTPFCGLEGCQSGVEGDPCSSSLVCGVSAPICGPDGCQNGGAGDSCSVDEHCGVAPFCGPAGCQNGAAGDPCSDGGDCAVEASVCTPFGCSAGNAGDECSLNDHCSATAPICGPDLVCQAGDEGDSCTIGADCAAESPFCNPDGECQDGSEGDYCDNREEVCGGSASICGPDGFCQDGSQDDPCETEDDCGAALSCTGEVCHLDGAGFVLINPGVFTMGSPAEEFGRDDDENQHQVTLTNGFLVQETEVTQAEWEALMGTENNPSTFFACGSDCPVENVNWWEALAYANALSSLEGLDECYTLTGCTESPGNDMTCQGVSVNADDGDPYECTGYRLPTEAEWEFAYRAGTTTAFHNGAITNTACDGDANLDLIAWYCVNAGSITHPVAQMNPNAADLYDMAGNVWEWCWDFGGVYPAEPITDPVGPADGTDRVRRGGAWSSPASSPRAANRNDSLPGATFSSTGFRLARTNP